MVITYVSHITNYHFCGYKPYFHIIIHKLNSLWLLPPQQNNNNISHNYQPVNLTMVLTPSFFQQKENNNRVRTPYEALFSGMIQAREVLELMWTLVGQRRA
jgi:hypothetical protein